MLTIYCANNNIFGNVNNNIGENNNLNSAHYNNQATLNISDLSTGYSTPNQTDIQPQEDNNLSDNDDNGHEIDNESNISNSYLNTINKANVSYSNAPSRQNRRRQKPSSGIVHSVLKAMPSTNDMLNNRLYILYNLTKGERSIEYDPCKKDQQKANAASCKKVILGLQHEKKNQIFYDIYYDITQYEAKSPLSLEKLSAHVSLLNSIAFSKNHNITRTSLLQKENRWNQIDLGGEGLSTNFLLKLGPQFAHIVLGNSINEENKENKFHSIDAHIGNKYFIHISSIIHQIIYNKNNEFVTNITHNLAIIKHNLNFIINIGKIKAFNLVYKFYNYENDNKNAFGLNYRHSIGGIITFTINNFNITTACYLHDITSVNTSEDQQQKLEFKLMFSLYKLILTITITNKMRAIFNSLPAFSIQINYKDKQDIQIKKLLSGKFYRSKHDTTRTPKKLRLHRR